MPSAAPSWDFVRSAAAVRVMVEVAGERGVDLRTALSGSGLRPADLREPDLEVEAAQELAVARTIVQALEDEPGLGSAVGLRITLGMFGILGFAMLASRTAREALRLCDRGGYDVLGPLFLRPWIEEREEALHVVCDGRDVPADVRAFITARDLSCSVALLDAISPGRPALRVATTLQDDAGNAFAAALGDWSVRLGSDRNEIIIANHEADQPLPNADEHTIRECERVNRELLARRQRRTDIASEVRAAMLRRRPLVGTLDQIAAERHVEPRTLRRHLAAEGTSFRLLADDVRQAVSSELLQTGLTVDEVATRLGYHDAATFSRAFRRWTGQTPGSMARSASSGIPHDPAHGMMERSLLDDRHPR
ncbi:MAG: AraC family transcriptional regulator [Solirubrobacterales bacterium]|nr:AraC family transcriptional regulator [Solirubrobacterales bacterium]